MLIDSGPDQIEWFEEQDGVDEHGAPIRKPSDTPTETFTAQVQRVSSEEASGLGQLGSEVYSFQTSRDLQGGESLLVVNGRETEVLGVPLRQGRSPRTASTKVRFIYLTRMVRTGVPNEH